MNKKYMKKIGSFVAAISLLLPLSIFIQTENVSGSLMSEIVDITVSEDTFITQKNPDKNCGDKIYLKVRNRYGWNGEDLYGLDALKVFLLLPSAYLDPIFIPFRFLGLYIDRICMWPQSFLDNFVFLELPYRISQVIWKNIDIFL